MVWIRGNWRYLRYLCRGQKVIVVNTRNNLQTRTVTAQIKENFTESAFHSLNLLGVPEFQLYIPTMFFWEVLGGERPINEPLGQYLKSVPSLCKLDCWTKFVTWSWGVFGGCARNIKNYPIFYIGYCAFFWYFYSALYCNLQSYVWHLLNVCLHRFIFLYVIIVGIWHNQTYQIDVSLVCFVCFFLLMHHISEYGITFFWD